MMERDELQYRYGGTYVRLRENNEPALIDSVVGLDQIVVSLESGSCIVTIDDIDLEYPELGYRDLTRGRIPYFYRNVARIYKRGVNSEQIRIANGNTRGLGRWTMLRHIFTQPELPTLRKLNTGNAVITNTCSIQRMEEYEHPILWYRGEIAGFKKQDVFYVPEIMDFVAQELDLLDYKTEVLNA